MNPGKNEMQAINTRVIPVADYELNLLSFYKFINLCLISFYKFKFSMHTLLVTLKEFFDLVIDFIHLLEFYINLLSFVVYCN